MPVRCDVTTLNRGSKETSYRRLGGAAKVAGCTDGETLHSLQELRTSQGSAGHRMQPACSAKEAGSVELIKIPTGAYCVGSWR